MSFIEDLGDVKTKVKSGVFEIAESRQQMARIVEIIHIGTHENPGFKDKKGNNLINDQFVITYELPEDLISQGDFAGQPKTVKQFVNNKTAKKSTLRALMESVEKRDMEDEEASNYALFSLLDKPVMLNIVHKKNKKGDGHTAAIAQYGISAIHKSMNVPQRHYDLKALYLPKFNEEVFSSLPEWLQKLVNINDIPKGLRLKVNF